MFILPILAALQLQIPQPVGFVNDFAGVIGPREERAMAVLIEEVRQKSRGEIVVVTLADLGGREAMEVARDIGRTWRVGAMGEAGDRARNAGVVLLLKPGERPGDGRSDIFIATGTGAEGFITDARAGRIRDAVGQAAVRGGNFSSGLLVGVQMLSEAYAEEFGFDLTGRIAQAPRAPPRRRTGIPIGTIVLLVFFILIMAGGRGRGVGGAADLAAVDLAALAAVEDLAEAEQEGASKWQSRNESKRRCLPIGLQRSSERTCVL
jgi:uncharacterized protein